MQTVEIDAVAWVTLQFEMYCPPHKHGFHELSGGARWCGNCLKEEADLGRSCLVCSFPSDAGTVTIYNGDGDVTGPLCDVCREGLADATAGAYHWAA